MGDEFDAPSLNTSLWTVVDPLGDALVTQGGGVLSIAVPGGVAHDIWTSGALAPRVMQTVANADFQVDVKFTSPVTARFQMQGLIVEQDASNMLRFNLHHDGTNVRAYVSSIIAGVAEARGIAVVNNPTVPLYMRVRRQVDTWTLFFSLDGSTWVQAVQVVQPLTVTRLGPFAGNQGDPPPAMTAQVDYLRETSGAQPMPPAHRLLLPLVWR